MIPSGEGEIVGDSPERRVEILSDHEALHATWSRFGPGREGADLHVHRHHTDLFYVLDGELTIRLGVEDEPAAVPAGKLARVPPMVVHGFRNGSDADVRYLNLHAPGQGFADYMRAIRDGRELTYDQVPPPAEGVAPVTEVAIGGEESVLERPGMRESVLCDVEAIAISEITGEPGGPSPEPHLHGRQLESIYILEGVLGLTLGERELRAEAGSWVQVPSGVRHGFSFPGSEPVRFLSLHTPSSGSIHE